MFQVLGLGRSNQWFAFVFLKTYTCSATFALTVFVERVCVYVCVWGLCDGVCVHECLCL